MYRYRMVWLFVILLIGSSLACNAFAEDVEPGALTLPPPPLTTVQGSTPGAGVTTTPGGIAPTATLPGTQVAGTVPAGATSGVPMVTTLVDLNVRSGPGVQYDRVNFLVKGQTAVLVGRDPATGWWKIQCPSNTTGTECWVSGGAQYTVATNAGGVPVAAVPATPTAVPATATPQPTVTAQASTTGEYVVYADQTGLWLLPLNTAQNPPSAAAAVQLVTNPSIQRILISPDGQKIAYVSGVPEANDLHVINRDGSGEKVLVRSIEMPGGGAETAVLLSYIQWLADNQTLAFNTNLTNLVGPGVSSQEDLWTIGLNGTLQNPFPAGTGGGFFAISNNNQVILSQEDKVIRANLNGSGAETLITFPFINTASEYIYYPQAQWTADNSQAFVAIPSQEPFASNATAALWRIPSSGTAVQLGNLQGNILFNPVAWSSNGSMLGYVKQLIDPSNPPPVVTLADSVGQNQAAYTTESSARFLAWNPNGSRFLYTTSTIYAVGQAGFIPTAFPLANTQGVAAGLWLNNDVFVIAVGDFTSWNINIGTAAGLGATLATVTTSGGLAFDVWGP